MRGSRNVVCSPLAYFEVWEMAIHSDVFAASQPWEVLINVLVLEQTEHAYTMTYDNSETFISEYFN
jgi:hypothetical protein